MIVCHTFKVAEKKKVEIGHFQWPRWTVTHLITLPHIWLRIRDKAWVVYNDITYHYLFLVFSKPFNRPHVIDEVICQQLWVLFTSCEAKRKLGDAVFSSHQSPNSQVHMQANRLCLIGSARCSLNTIHNSLPLFTRHRPSSMSCQSGVVSRSRLTPG